MVSISPSQIDRQLSSVLVKIEDVVSRMQNQSSGVTLQTIKQFRANYTDVSSGAEIITWLMNNFNIENRAQAGYFAKTIAAHGYLFSLPDCKLIVKDDGTYHRFQSSFFWPSFQNEITNVSYAVYLCKRLISNKGRLQLEVFELERFTKLQKLLQRKWELVYIEAEAKYKVDKKREKTQKRVFENQERAFWNLHRPPPGFNSVFEADLKKIVVDDQGFGPRHGMARVSLQLAASQLSEDLLNHALDDAMRKVDDLQELLHKRRIKSSNASESLIQKTTQYATYDPVLFTPFPSNPWISDENAFWQDNNKRIIPPEKQVHRWGFSLNDLLRDPQGTMIFLKFLEREFSAENLRFWLTVEEFKFCPLSSLESQAEKIHTEYLKNDSLHSINVDQRAVELVNERMKEPTHFTFEPAQGQIYTLMKTDSYQRFLKSEQYLTLLRHTPNAKRGIVDAIKNWRSPVK